MIGGKRRVTIFALFYGSICGGFWSFLCRPGWRHCLLIITIYFPTPHAFARRYSLIVNPCGWGLHLDVVWRTPEQIVQEFISEGVSAVVKQTIELPPRQPFILRGVFSCVSVSKAALGLKNWRIITPYGLFRFMVSNGAQVIFRSGDDGHDRELIRDGRQATAGTGCGDARSAAATGSAYAGGGSADGARDRRAAAGD